MARSVALQGTMVVGNTIIGQTEFTFTPTQEVPEVTGMDSAGFKVFLAGLRGATGTGTGFLDSTGEPPSIKTGGIISFELKDAATPIFHILGSAIVTEAPITASTTDGTAISLAFTVTSSWTETAGYETSLS